jgi:hypothetical protein
MKIGDQLTARKGTDAQWPKRAIVTAADGEDWVIEDADFGPPLRIRGNIAAAVYGTDGAAPSQRDPYEAYDLRGPDLAVVEAELPQYDERTPEQIFAEAENA